MLRLRIIFLVAIGSANVLLAQTPAKKVALIIGAQTYTSLPPLRNSLNDARSMATSLKAKGFQVETLYDPKTKREIRDAITRYYNLMRDQTGAVGLIYYAGHGMQYDGDNYVIPTSASLQNPGDLDDQCVKMNSVMAVLKATSQSLNILLLDACRSIPSFTRGTEEGLTRMEAPQGSIIVFATQPGKVASDGTGANGLFTSKLIKVIDEPNLNITDVFKKVKQEVYMASKEAQLPSVEDNSIGGDFYFATRTIAVPVQTSGMLPVSTVKKETPDNSIEFYTTGKLLSYSSKIEESISYLTPAALQGNAGAQCALGEMYRDGRGVDENFQTALSYFRRSADQNFAQGQANLGSMYYQGNGVTRDYDEAQRWFRLAANQSNPVAMDQLSLMYAGGYGVEADEIEGDRWKRKAVEQYKKLADAGNSYAAYRLAQKYFNGTGVTKNYPEALNYFRQAADQGITFSHWNMYTFYKNGYAVEKNETIANDWFGKYFDLLLKEADENNEGAMISIGWNYKNGTGGIPKNEEKAQLWYRKYFEKVYARVSAGEWVDQRDLADLYSNGNGVEKSDEKAFEWNLKAAAQGNAWVQIRIANAYRDGKGTTKNYDEAVNWFLKAADQRNVSAYTSLGSLYYDANWSGKDFGKSLQWYLKAAKRSSADAMGWVGVFYRDGLDVPKDNTAAYTWFQKAVDNGDDGSLGNLGWMYQNGYGVTQDYDQALKYYRRSADKGYSYGYSRLGFMYENGFAVSKDITTAVSWYRKAASGNDQYAKDRLKELGY